MLDVGLVVIALVVAAYLALSPRLYKSSNWNATVTPLASIMGSGFLVSAPLLAGSVGTYALFCILGLLVLAYLIGGAIRFNIKYFEPIENESHGSAQALASASRFVLAGAYFISVSYYLQLLAAFGLSVFGVQNQFQANLISSGLILVIGVVGIWRGLSLLEKIERYAVSLNLGVVAALLAALIFYNLKLANSGEWELPAMASEIDFGDFRILLGMLIIVQGFETSRYLGSKHSAEQRIRTMRRAQLLSGFIYLLFIGLVTVLFHDGLGSDVTAIITMVAPIAVILPILLTVSAIGSQFSAAVADNAGAGGLIGEIAHNKVPIRYAYMLILLVVLALTWETNVNEIISYASRAFALYYMLQCIVALIVVWKQRELSGRGMRVCLYTILALACLLVFALGLPSE